MIIDIRIIFFYDQIYFIRQLFVIIIFLTHYVCHLSEKNAIGYMYKGIILWNWPSFISLAGLGSLFSSKYYSINRFIGIDDIRLTGVFNISSYGNESGISKCIRLSDLSDYPIFDYPMSTVLNENISIVRVLQ